MHSRAALLAALLVSFAAPARADFASEALLHDFVIDRSGRTRDLMIMAHDVEGFTDSVN